MRVASISVDIPDIKKFSSGGRIGINTDLQFEASKGNLIVGISIHTNIKKLIDGQVSDGESDSENAGTASVKYLVTYSLPEGHGLEDGYLEKIEPSQAETFVHALQPILVIRLNTLLHETGAVNLSIPPHMYAANSGKFIE
jgi:hypothetical protein